MSVTKESEYFFRVSLLLLDTGGKTFQRRIQSLPCFNNFEEFLCNTKHVLYHLWRPGPCSCPPQPSVSTSRQQCTFTGKKQHLHKTQWDSLYRLQTGLCSCRHVHECRCLNTEEDYCNCAQTLDCPCIYHPIPGVELQSLDLTLAGTILRNSDLLQRDEKEIVKKIIDLRNEVYGHTEKAAFNDLTFNKYRELLSEEIQKLADKCNDRSFYTEIITDIYKIKGTVLDASNTNRVLQIWKECSNLTRMITDEQRAIQMKQTQLNERVDKRFSELRKEQSSLNAKVHQIGTNMVSNVADVKEIKRDIESLKRSKDDSCSTGVARNLISNTALVLEKQKTNIYIRQPYVFEEAKHRLTAAKVIVISGIGGRGKTSMAHELMMEVTNMDSSYTPVILNEPMQWDEVVDGSKSYVALVDDIVGKTNLDEKCMLGWERRFESMWACASKGKVLLIIGCRRNILEEAKFTFEKYDLFKGEYILDLSSPIYDLIFDDKRNILQKYCERFNVRIAPDSQRDVSGRNITQDELNQIASTNTLVGFPQLCSLFFSKASFFQRGIDFFLHASEELIKDISSLRRKEPFVYSILFYAVLQNNFIFTDDLNNVLMTDICAILKITALDSADVQDLLTEQPLTTYLERSPVQKTMYQFKHITIMEAVFKSVCKSYPEFLLKNATPHVLGAYVRSSSYLPRSGEIFVNIPANLHDLFARRLVDEKIEDVRLIVRHPSLSDKSFVSAVIQILYKSQFIEEVFISSCNFGCVFLPSAVLETEIRRYRQYISEKSHGCEGFLSFNAFKSAIVFSLISDNFDLFARTLECMSALSFNIHSHIYVTLDDGYTLISMYIDVGLLACRLGRKRAVQYLISEIEINTDVEDLFGCTLLHYSAAQGWNEIAELLLRKNTRLLNRVNKWGETPILMAARLSLEEAVVLNLIRHEADLSVKNKIGCSLVYYAGLKNWIDVIKKVRSNCPSILFDKNIRGESPVISCFKRPLVWISSTMELLLHLSDVSGLHDNNGNNVLHYLARMPAQNCAHDIIGTILGKDKSLLNQKNHEGETPLIYAAKQNARWNISLLITQFPSDLYSSDHGGNTVLHYLASNCSVDLIDLILQKQTDLMNMRNKNGQTPLLFAYKNMMVTEYDSLELIQRFVQYGVDLKSCDNDENSILHHVALWACSGYGRRYETIEKLLTHDKHLIYMRNKFQQIPFVYLVCSRSCDYSFHLESEISSQLVNLLVSDDLYLEAQDQYGNTLLHYICRFGVLTMEMRALPQMTLKNVFGMDAILYAACYGMINESIVTENLCEEICFFVDHFGRSILHYCALNFWANAVKVILEKYHYHRSLKDKAGDTPLSFALRYGKIDSGIGSNTNEVHETILTLLQYKELFFVKEDGDTMLHLYVAQIPFITQKFIQMAVDADPYCLSKRNSLGLTPLMVYLKMNLYPVDAEMLISTDLHVTDNDGNSLSHYCVFLDTSAVVRIIKENGTNALNERNKNGETPLIFAAKRGKGMFVIQSLFENADLRCSDLNGNTLLHFCLANGWVNVAEEIAKFDRGLLNYQNRLGQTPLIFGLGVPSGMKQLRSIAVLRMLNYSPNLKLTDFNGNTLLHISAIMFCFPVVRRILEDDSTLIQLLNKDEQSPTMFMMEYALLCWENAKPILNFMLKFDRNLDENDRNGLNLLQHCTRSVVRTYICSSGYPVQNAQQSK